MIEVLLKKIDITHLYKSDKVPNLKSFDFTMPFQTWIGKYEIAKDT